MNIDNRPAAIYALRQYLRLCMPMTIETQINTTVKLFERGGTVALGQAASRPMIDARTVETAVTRVRFSPMTDVGARIRSFFFAGPAANKTRVNTWLKENQFVMPDTGGPMPIGVFVRSASRAKQQELARELGLR